MAKAKPCPPEKGAKGKMMDDKAKPGAKGAKPMPPWLKKGGK